MSADPADMPPADIPAHEFRAHMHRVADLVADYLEHVADSPVLPKIKPGDVRAQLAAAPPETAEPLEKILTDYQRIIEPNMTHWNHPGFMAYFAITGSAPGILAEALTAGLNVNAMLWRTGPAPTELEETTCDWLRQMMNLPPAFKGHINDTASISSFLAIAAARERAGFDIRERGMSGRLDLPRLTVYLSEHAHSSIDKACLALGLGLESLRKVPTDAEFRMLPDKLAEMIAADRAAAMRPICIVATTGTTSTASVDPVAPIAEIAARENCWLHVDGAYAGAAAIIPELRPLFDGMENADSMVVNPHKWLFVPVDCSVLFTRDEVDRSRPRLHSATETLKRAFSVIPEYLKTSEAGVTNLMDLGLQLGRRFRSLKMWFVFRAFGREGLIARIRNHCQLAQEFAGWVRGDPDFELVAPVHFSTVCFRCRMHSSTHRSAASEPSMNQSEIESANRLNDRLLESINAAGPIFLSSTKLNGRTTLRLTIGNLRTHREHVELAWKLIQAARGGLMLDLSDLAAPI